MPCDCAAIECLQLGAAALQKPDHIIILHPVETVAIDFKETRENDEDAPSLLPGGSHDRVSGYDRRLLRPIENVSQSYSANALGKVVEKLLDIPLPRHVHIKVFQIWHVLCD